MINLALFFVLFCFFPVLSAPISFFSIFISKKYDKIYLIFFLLSICLISLYYIPTPIQDAYRHFHSANQFSGYVSISAFINFLKHSTVEYTSYPLYGVIIYIIGKTQIFTLLSFLSIFLTYFLVLYVFLNLKVTSLALKFLSVLAILCSVNYLFTISGLRYPLSVSLTIFIMYLEAKYERKTMIVLYLVPVLIHSAMGIYLVIRILWFLWKNFSYKKMWLFTIGFPVAINLADIGNRYFSNAYVKSILRKIAIYKDNDSYSTLITNTMYLRMYALVVLAGIFIIIFMQCSKKEILYKKNIFIYMTIYTSLLQVGSIFMINFIDRNATILTLMLILSIGILVKESCLSELNANCLLIIIIGIGILYNKNIFAANFYITWSDYLSHNIIDLLKEIPKINY